VTWILQDAERSERWDLEAVEFGLRSRILEMGGDVLERMMNDNSRGETRSSIPCGCGQSARLEGFRAKEIQTLFGRIEVVRAYYYCSSCGKGQCPHDGNWDVQGTRFSPALRRLMSRAGANESFEQGRNDLREYAAIAVETKAVERIAEGVGTDIRRAVEIQREKILSGNVISLFSSPPVETVYIAMDGTGIPVVPQETIGRPGKGAEGKAHTREAKLGCVFTQTTVDEKGKPVRDEDSTTYVGKIETAEELGQDLYAEVVRRGLLGAKRQIVLGDGAIWIWELAEEHFPEAIQIIDLYHAREHVWKVGYAVYGEKSKAMEIWVQKRIRELDQGDIGSIRNAFKRVKISSEGGHQTVQTELEFFRKNRDRMQYAQFKSQGFFVGSGVIEAGCKTVIGQRLKQSGMQWTVDGANSIVTLRCCLLSGEWEDYWASRTAG
jgi:hypothetical protein